MQGSGRYHGDPFSVHLRLPDLTPAMFNRWLALFHETCGDVLPTEEAAAFGARAERIAHSLRMGLFERMPAQQADLSSLGAVRRVSPPSLPFVTAQRRMLPHAAIQKACLMLSDHHRALVSATVPALRAHGGEITRVFYRDMLAAHPELFDYFNPANQRDGGQAASLAASVLAYASHIANPAPLAGMIRRISSKHASLEIKPAHYPIVGRYLLGAIKDVLGDAATPEIIEAWSAAYGQLAAIMIEQEATLAETGAAQPQGWRGFKPFRVARKVRESEVMASFYLQPADGTPVPSFVPGQYLSLRVRVPGFDHDQVRQYSLSSAPNGRDYRISVKREPAPVDAPDAPPGLVSTWLHEAVHEGDLLDVHVPLGDFVLQPGSHPVVLLSGGSGITAVLSMLEHLTGDEGGGREVLFLHGARHRGHHAFGSHVRALARRRSGVRVADFVW